MDKSRGLSQVLAEFVHDGTTEPVPTDPEAINNNFQRTLGYWDAGPSYTYGDDLISRNFNTTSSYYHYDGQMSTRQMTDANADPALVKVTNVYSYDAFGTELEHYGLPTNESGTTPTANAYRYTGEQLDEPTGQYYLRARYYDPTIGRFCGRDPYSGRMAEPATLHKYAYCGNEPIGRVDPSGAIWWLIQGILAHKFIQNDYYRTRGFGRPWSRLFEVGLAGAGRGGGFGYVDIMDSLFGEIYEIKPNTSGSIAVARAQLGRYMAAIASRNALLAAQGKSFVSMRLGVTWPVAPVTRRWPFGIAATITYWRCAPGIVVYRIIGADPALYAWSLVTSGVFSTQALIDRLLESGANTVDDVLDALRGLGPPRPGPAFAPNIAIVGAMMLTAFAAAVIPLNIKSNIAIAVQMTSSKRTSAFGL